MSSNIHSHRVPLGVRRVRFINFVTFAILALIVLGAECAWTAAQQGPLFEPPVTYSSVGPDNKGVALGDLNGDGKLDIVAANLGSGTSFQVGSLQVFLGNGDGTFNAGPSYTLTTGGASSVALADLNGDGKLDLIVSEVDNSGCFTEDVVGVLLGNGDGTFRPEQTYKSGGLCAGRLAVADINGDGKPDVLVLNHCLKGLGYCGSYAVGIVGILLGNGDGTFQTVRTYNSRGAAPVDIAVADVNRDGKPDMLVINGGAENGSAIRDSGNVFLGNGDGTFQNAEIFDSSVSDAMGLGSLAVADLNGDGKLDVVETTCFYSGCSGGIGALTVRLGNGDGTFQTPQVYRAGGSSAVQVILADVDLDGKLDAVIIDNSESPNSLTGGVSVLLGNGDGTFVTPARHYSSGGAGAMFAALGDLNGDSKPDLVFANWLTVCGAGCNTPPGTVGVLLSSAKFPTSVSFISSLSSSVYGQSITFTATVTPVGPLPLSGTVAFKSATGVAIGSAKVQSNGTAVLTKSKLNVGAYSIMAVYSGDVNNRSSSSPIVNQVVSPATSKATLTSSANPSTSGQTVTFTAKITSPTVIPTGPVTFAAGKTVLGTTQLSGGKAVFTTPSLPVGSTVVTVTYQGNLNISASSASITQVVQ